MGQPRLVHLGVIAALALGAVACGGDESLLQAADVQEAVYGEGGSTSQYKPTSMDPAVRGTVSGRVTFTGRQRPNKLRLSDAYCSDANPNGLMSEEFRVGPENGLQGVIVWVKAGLDKQKWETPEEAVVLDQVNCQYTPHIVVVQTNQPLVVKSSDHTLHNVASPVGRNQGFNFVQNSPEVSDPMTFRKTEMAKLIKCDVHSWMRAYVGIVAHPCHAITAEDGTFTIDGVPPGTYLLGAWHEALGEQEIEIVVPDNGALTHNFEYPRQ